jgi:hypothetical protein
MLYYNSQEIHHVVAIGRLLQDHGFQGVQDTSKLRQEGTWFSALLNMKTTTQKLYNSTSWKL